MLEALKLMHPSSSKYPTQSAGIHTYHCYNLTDQAKEPIDTVAPDEPIRHCQIAMGATHGHQSGPWVWTFKALTWNLTMFHSPRLMPEAEILFLFLSAFYI